MHLFAQSLVLLMIFKCVFFDRENEDTKATFFFFFFFNGRTKVIAQGFPGGASGKNSQRFKRCWLDPWVRKIPWRRAWQPTVVFLPGEFHEKRSLVGYGPWGCKE